MARESIYRLQNISVTDTNTLIGGLQKVKHLVISKSWTFLVKDKDNAVVKMKTVPHAPFVPHTQLQNKGQRSGI